MRYAVLMLVLALATLPLRTSAQTSTREAKLGTFYAYGIDAELVRLDKIERVARIDARHYVRTVDPGDGHVGYLLLTLSVKNRRSSPGYVPALVTTVALDAGPAIAPPVYGPFVNDEAAQADAQTRIAPRSTARLRLAIIDIPNGRTIRAITLSPNDATTQYYFRLKPKQITSLATVPR